VTTIGPNVPLALPEGVGVALVTIFRDDQVDIEATVNHAQACVERGCTSVLVAGTTGEPWRLSAGQRIELGVAVKARMPDTFLFVGTGDGEAAKAIALTAAVAEAGVADALLALSATDERALDYYGKLAHVAGGTRLLAYHLPDMSPPGIATDLVPQLPVAGIKDSSDSTDRLAALLVGDQATYVGNENALLLAGRCGARGAIVALANTVPELCLGAWRGDAGAQRELFRIRPPSFVDFPTGLKPEVHAP
jgi:4-hydroxy-tetrahydrodipicolinate synthase